MGFLRRIPAWAEFAIAVGGAFGYFIVSSIVIASSKDLFVKTHHSSGSLFALVGIEVVITAILLPLLWVRGWTIARVGLRPSWMDLLYGIGLAVSAYAAYAIVWIVFVTAAPDAARDAARISVVANGISPTAAIVTPLINALFEELFVAGYIITALKGKHGEWTAINVSVGVRLAYHLYQGAHRRYRHNSARLDFRNLVRTPRPVVAAHHRARGDRSCRPAVYGEVLRG